MDEALVLRDDADGVTTLTLNRPEKLNALLPESFVELRSQLDAIAADDSVRCVVLAGAGRSFCAGNDLNGISEGRKAPTPNFVPETIDALDQLPQPTVGRIQGHCFTGGLELALACDILIAADDAQLGDTHGQWGLVPIWGMSVRLPERIGTAQAKAMSYTSRRVSGQEAAHLGLVERAVPAAELDAAVQAMATAIAANSPGTNRRMKKLYADAERLERQAALEHERSRPYGHPEDMAERMGAR